MAAMINAPAKCELRSVICFLQAEGYSAAEIHCRMSIVYGENSGSRVGNLNKASECP